MALDSATVEVSDYRRHDPSGGYEGLYFLDDGSIAAFVENKIGDYSLGDETGVRVYKVNLGDRTPENPPAFESFRGFYKFDLNNGNIADISETPGSNNLVAIVERNGFPNGHMWPATIQI